MLALPDRHRAEPLLAEVGTELQNPDGLMAVRPDLSKCIFALKLGDLARIGTNIERWVRKSAPPTFPGLFTLDPRRDA